MVKIESITRRQMLHCIKARHKEKGFRLTQRWLNSEAMLAKICLNKPKKIDMINLQ